MPIVLDASVALAWCFQDEATPYAGRVLDLLAADSAVVPPIWPLEVANAISTAERRQRLELAAGSRFVELLRALPIRLDEASLDRALGNVLNVAREHRLSSYDASYLELAMREGLPLATADERLAEAARAAGVDLVR